VYAIFHEINDAVRLRTITLAGAIITEEQIKWMEQRKIGLANHQFG
jgi:hypothetical protein